MTNYILINYTLLAIVEYKLFWPLLYDYRREIYLIELNFKSSYYWRVYFEGKSKEVSKLTIKYDLWLDNEWLDELLEWMVVLEAKLEINYWEVNDTI